MNRSVFLTYAGPDRAYAEKVRGVLRRHDVSVFLDSEMSAGGNWRNEIADRLATADAVLVVVGASTHRSQFIDQEARLARELGKPVIAVKIEPGYVLPAILYDVEATWTDLAGCHDAVSKAFQKLRT